MSDLHRLGETGIEFMLVDLIAAKEALGRDKDLIVARELRTIHEKLRGD